MEPAGRRRSDRGTAAVATGFGLRRATGGFKVGGIFFVEALDKLQKGKRVSDIWIILL